MGKQYNTIYIITFSDYYAVFYIFCFGKIDYREQCKKHGKTTATGKIRLSEIPSDNIFRI